MKHHVTHNMAQHRFEISLGSEMALLEYVLRGNAINMRHTEVPPDHQNQGIGEQLVRAALDYARQAGLRVVPSCPFVASFVAQHPEYQEIVQR